MFRQTWIILKVSFIMMLREPTVLIWSLGFPILIYFTMTKWAPGSNSAIKAALPFAAYTVMLNSIYGVGMLLVSWRDSGFLRTFTQTKRSQHLLRIGLLLGIGVTNIFFISIFLAIIGILREWGTPLQNASILLGVIGLSLVFATFSSVLNRIRAPYQRLHVFVSFASWLMLYGVSAYSDGDHRNPLIATLAAFNPLLYGTRLLSVFFNLDALLMTNFWLFVALITGALIAFGMPLSVIPADRR